MPEGREGDLGGVKKLAGAVLRDGVDEDAVGGAGDEVSHALVAGEHGLGVAKGFLAVHAGKHVGLSELFALFEFGFVGAVVGGAAAADGGFGVGGLEAGGGVGLEALEGFGNGALFEGFFGHGGIS